MIKPINGLESDGQSFQSVCFRASLFVLAGDALTGQPVSHEAICLKFQKKLPVCAMAIHTTTLSLVLGESLLLSFWLLPWKQMPAFSLPRFSLYKINN